jgi:uncharacterized protein YdgA (DUF945 family)
VNRRIGIALAVVVVILAYPVAAWMIGLRAEHVWQQREQQITQRYPFFETVKREYHRSVYSSTEEVTYRIGGSLGNGMRAFSAVAPTPDLQITVRNTIHHGPLPQLRAFAPATVDTEVILPPPIKQKLAELLGEQATLGIRTRLHWFGGSTTTVHSPAFERKIPDAAAINWRGLEGTADVGSDLGYYKGAFTAPGLEVKAAKANVILENMRGATDQQSSAFEGIYVGTLDMSLARLAIEPTSAGHAVSLQNLAMNSKLSAQGEYVEIAGGLNASSIKFEQFNLTHVGYELRASHLYGPSLATMNKSFQSVESVPTASPSPDKVQEILKTTGMELLLHDPILELPRIGFAMPEGELLISVKASAHGFTRDEIDGPPGALKAAIARHLQASADMRIDTALLDKLLDTSGNADKFTAQLQGLQRQGYLKLDGKALTTHLSFESGQLQVNGLSFPPVGAPPPPGGHP